MCALSTLAYFALPAGTAHAAKVPLFYNTGEDIFVAGDGALPAPFDQEPDLQGAQAGYKCDIFGFFYAYFSVKNCKPVAFKGDTFWDDAELATAIAKAHPEDTMQLGFWKGYGKFPLGLIVLGVVGVVILGKVRGGKDE
jgi:hypothetical protein